MDSVIQYVVYDLGTGEILRSCRDSASYVPNEEWHDAMGEGIVYGIADDATHYVQGRVIVERPTFTIPDVITVVADGVSEETFMLPAGTKVIHDEVESVLADGELTLSADIPGSYTLTLDHFPYKPKTITVIAEEPTP